MATGTTNLNLTKPANSEAWSVATWNANSDVIDAAVGPRESAVGTTTVANTTTETVIETLTIPAGVASAGKVFEMAAFCKGDATGSPNLQLRCRVGGVGGVTVGTVTLTAVAGSAKSLRVRGTAQCVTAGTTGTWLGSLEVLDEFGTTIPLAADVNVISTPVTKDTTIAQTLVLTAQWSAAAAGNTVSRYSGYGRQII